MRLVQDMLLAQTKQGRTSWKTVSCSKCFRDEKTILGDQAGQVKNPEESDKLADD